MCMRKFIGTLSYWCRRTTVFVRRAGHSRGFGIQSPSAYRFDREVINDHRLYEAYAELKKRYGHRDRLSTKLCQLYFRIAAHAQAGQWGMCLLPDGLASAYVQAGCAKTRVVDCRAGEDLSAVAASDVLLMRIGDNWRAVFNAFVDGAQADSILIVERINESKASARAWQRIIRDVRTCVTFDLYYCGIVRFDHTKSKLHYIINF